MSKDVVAQFFAAGARDDVDAAVACFTEDAVWIAAEGNEPGTTYRRDEIPDFLIQLIGVRKDFESKGVSLHYGDIVEVGDKVYLEATVTAPNGTVLDRIVDIFTIRGGKIAVKDVFRKA